MSSTPRSHAQTQPGQSKQPSSDVSEKSNKLAKAVAMVGGLDGGEGYGDANCSDDDNEVYRSTIDKKSRVDAIENARKQFAELALLNDIAEIAWADLHADTKTPLGSGAFGVVYRGMYKNQPVAVKQLKGLSPEQLDEFKREARVMHSLGTHPNVIKLVGICTEPGLFSLVMPLYPKGSVHERFIVNKEELDMKLLVKIALDAAQGIAHLHSEHLVHRDIAARNILLDDECNGVVGDFSMSRLISASGVIGKTRSVFGPIKWMAPECIQHQQYSVKSDAYSFAMFLVEMLTKDEPYGKNVKVKQVLHSVLRGERPMLPADCPPELKKLIEDCWQQNPNDRPRFKEIVRRLREIQQSLSATSSEDAAAKQSPQSTQSGHHNNTIVDR